MGTRGIWRAILTWLGQINLAWLSMLTGALAGALCVSTSAIIAAHSLGTFALFLVFAIVPTATGGAICALAMFPVVKLFLRRKVPLHAVFAAFVPTLVVAALSGAILQPTSIPDHIPAAIATISVAAIVICAICAWLLPNYTLMSHPYCNTCEYNLTGNESNRCPECGSSVSVCASAEHTD